MPLVSSSNKVFGKFESNVSLSTNFQTSSFYVLCVSVPSVVNLILLGCGLLPALKHILSSVTRRKE